MFTSQEKLHFELYIYFQSNKTYVLQIEIPISNVGDRDLHVKGGFA